MSLGCESLLGISHDVAMGGLVDLTMFQQNINHVKCNGVIIKSIVKRIVLVQCIFPFRYI